MNPPDTFTFDDTSFDIDDSGDILGLAKSLINGQHPGILATVDEAGRPQVRWMSTLAIGSFPVFHTLTGANARKLRQIRANPAVNWMFFNKDLSLVVNLTGTARVVDDPAALKRIWQSIVDKTHTYFLNEYSHRPGFVAIETTVHSVEVNSPASGLKFHVVPNQLQPEPGPAIRAVA